MKKRHSIPSPIYHNDHLYWTNNDGTAYCQDAKTGEIKYQAKRPVTGRFAVYASGVNIAGNLYTVTRHHGTFVLPTQPEFRILAHNQFTSDTSGFSGSPAVSEGRLFLRSFSYLYCLGK